MHCNNSRLFLVFSRLRRFTGDKVMRYALLMTFVTAAAAADAPSIDLQNALQRAKAYSQQFLSADIAASMAREDRIQARAAFFPTVSALSEYIYTQPNGTEPGVFISNDGPHVYNDQAVVHAELFSATTRAEYRRARAAEAVAQAKRDIAARGLYATVVLNYYALVTTQRRLENAAKSVDEAQRFLDITQKQESGGEVSRADVIKAQLQFRQRQRELMDSRTGTEKAKLALGVLLFADPAQQFSVVDDLQADTALPSLEEIRAEAVAGNPEIRAAEAGHDQAAFGVKAARAAYLPSLSFDYFYGINANVFGIRGPDDRQNLGSVVQGTLHVPVWNWGATRSKVRQAELQQRQAEIDLNYAKRQLQKDVNDFYLEAQAARAQLDSLRGSVDLATESLRLTVLRYQDGEASALEVVDAQSTLAQARNSHDDGLARYRLALAGLQTLTGRF
jgi:outer membrane protein TolC